MAFLIKILFATCIVSLIHCDEELLDFEFSEPDEVMVAQESRQYQTIVKPPIQIYKPTGVTNSHRPQYNLDSIEDERAKETLEDLTLKARRVKIDHRLNQKLKYRETMIKDAVLRALERKDHVGNFAQLLPIIRAMTGNQRMALASLVASQVNTPPGTAPLNLSQVRSMFGNNNTATSDLMLPILLDMANLIRRAVRSGKTARDVRGPMTLPILRRSFTEDTVLDDDPFDIGVIDNRVHRNTDARNTAGDSRVSTRNTEDKTNIDNTGHNTVVKTDGENRVNRNADVEGNTNTDIGHNTVKADGKANKGDSKGDNAANTQTTAKTPRTRTRRPLRTLARNDNVTNTPNTIATNATNIENTKDDLNFTTPYPSTNSTTDPMAVAKAKSKISARISVDNGNLDLETDSTNTTLAQDLPVAEKLRAFNRFIDRKGIRRGTYPPKPPPQLRRTTAEPTLNPPPPRRRPLPARKLPTPVADQGNCELFTNTLCLHSEDYPTDLIVQSIRRNKAAAGALLADFKDPGEGALDGVTADQEAKYTADHYLLSNRRGDTANRDFASAGEAGFMCPSTVKYARPQRARATSGQWKYIVNTGEHTQTLRLEKCLKPKESCTYLTDNFKSKCVQVYNYHRLLTWDQQNGLHMDIFKVPTCCSCHIEGYSVSFPPLGHRVHETSSNENFPGEDLPAEHGNGAFEQIQPSINRPSKTPFSKKPLESFPPFDNHNLLSGSPFVHSKVIDNDEFSHPLDSYSSSYVTDSFNQASSIRNIKKPSLRNPIGVTANSFDPATISATLSSYLEPPTPSAPAFSFVKDGNNLKPGSQFKRGLVRNRNRPIRKKLGGPDDLSSAATSAIDNIEVDDYRDDLEEAEEIKTSVVVPSKRATIAPKLPSVSTMRPYEKLSTTSPHDIRLTKETTTGKRINYNYHPIIDFFEDGKDRNESIDREDNVTFVAPENEWKPIDKPHNSRSVHAVLTSRKKHK